MEFMDGILIYFTVDEEIYQLFGAISMEGTFRRILS